MNAERVKRISQVNFDKLSKDFDNSFQGSHSRLTYDIFTKSLLNCQADSILDIGCGTGALLEVLAGCNDFHHIAGLDISEKMVSRAIDRLGPSVDIKVGDAEHLPWKDELFGLVICNDSFHHYPHPLLVLNEIWRVLRPTGIFILCDFWVPIILRCLCNIQYKMPFYKGGDFHLYGFNEMSDILSRCSFTMKEAVVFRDKRAYWFVIEKV